MVMFMPGKTTAFSSGTSSSLLNADPFSVVATKSVPITSLALDGGDLADERLGRRRRGAAGRAHRRLRGGVRRRGTLRGADNKPIAIDGLWALQFGKGSVVNGPANTLFFTAGPDEETHGLFGTVTAG
jgi:hypothetical protein